MFWIETYFMLKILVPFLVIGILIIGFMLYQFMPTEKEQLGLVLDGRTDIYYSVAREPATQIITLYTKRRFFGWNQICKPIRTGTLWSAKDGVKIEYEKGNINFLI